MPHRSEFLNPSSHSEKASLRMSAQKSVTLTLFSWVSSVPLDIPSNKTTPPPSRTYFPTIHTILNYINHGESLLIIIAEAHTAVFKTSVRIAQ